MKKLVLSLLTSVVPWMSGTAMAAGDLEMTEALIKKLGPIYMKVSPNDSTRTGLGLRLGDLHAEKAKALSIEDLEKGRADRIKALRYYKDNLAGAEPAQKALVLIQMGHLSELNQDLKGAREAYSSVLRLPEATPIQKAESYFSMAESSFRQRNYGEAKGFYNEVLKIEGASSRGLAAYRVAWCDFHTGQINEGINGLVKILKNPELARRSSGPTGTADRQFQEEVSRDLVTFLAKRRVQTGDLKLVSEVSPESTRLPNLVFLAGEAERLGQHQEALPIWKAVVAVQKEPKDRLESWTHIAQLELTTGNAVKALEAYDQALNLWESVGNKLGTNENEIRTRLKNMLVEWNKAEKKNPSEELLKGYQMFVQRFPADSAMKLYLAQVARERKDYATAYQTFSELGQVNNDGKEAALLSAIETAEIAKNNEWLKSALNAYLKNSTSRTQLAQIQYQLAKLNYDQGDYAKAAEELRAFALGKGPANLRETASHLALDALGLLKDDARIQVWSAEFAAAFPTAQKEHLSVARKALVNQVAKLSEAGNWDGAWKVLTANNLKDASVEERALWLKNKLVVAEKRKDYASARVVADELVQLAQASTAVPRADYLYALSRKAWLAELVLDFDGALAATEKLPSEKDPGQRLLKLALFADLAQKDAKPYQVEFLKTSTDQEKKRAIAAELVREAKDPAKEFMAHRAILKTDAALASQLALEIYAKNPNPQWLKQSLAEKDWEKTPAYRLLQRHQSMKEWTALAAKVRGHQIDSKTQGRLSKSLRDRVKLLEESEQWASKAVATGDWTLQVLGLGLVAEQQGRFYQELMGLPLPTGLTPEQEQEYLGALSQQAAPHQTKAEDVKKKVAEFWAEKSAIKQIREGLQQPRLEMAKLVQAEVDLVKGFAPESVVPELTVTRSSTTVATGPSAQILESARSEVRKNPMRKESLQKLLELEEQRGPMAPMVGYLKARIESLDSNEGAVK